MYKLLPILFITVAMLTGCSIISGYKPAIEQGNIYTSEDISQLKIGMTKAQCAYILGNPVLDSAFTNDRWDFIYTLKPKGSRRTYKKYLTLTFDSSEHLIKITRSDEAKNLSKT